MESEMQIVNGKVFGKEQDEEQMKMIRCSGEFSEDRICTGDILVILDNRS